MRLIYAGPGRFAQAQHQRPARTKEGEVSDDEGLGSLINVGDA
jgi:hypothetical protein